MKKTLIFLFYAMFVALTSMGQTSTTIVGIVKDVDGKGLPVVSISVLRSTDSSIVKTDITEDNGSFSISLPNRGTYLLRCYSMGYQVQYLGPVTIAEGSQFKAPDIVLDKDIARLKEVTVSSKKPLIEVKADKVVFNVENSINATGSNAMELLRKSPGIVVDNNENITMKGKTGVKIYVDGKPTQLDAKDLAAYLRNINSNDIEAIEMISNPSAKYDASGNAGIVNIRLRKNKKIGTNGSVNLNFVDGIFKEGLTPKASGSANLNYRNKKINAFGNFGLSAGKYQNGLNLDRFQNDTNYIQRNIERNDERTVSIKGGVDYFADGKNTIGFLVTTNINDADWSSNGNTNIYDKNWVFVKKLSAHNDVPGSRTNNNVNLNYKYADKAGRELNVDADYGLFRGRGSSMQPNYYLDNGNNLLYSVINRNYTPTNIDIYTLKADWEQKLGKGKLGFGAKTAYVRTENTFDFFNVINDQPVKVLERSNQFRYTEQVSAAYANYSRQISTALSMQAGLRMENTASRGELTREDGQAQKDDTVVRNYTNLFPSAAFTWTVNKNHSLNLTYSRRIDRPSYQDLNPFENKLDELSFEKGNAFLRPQYTNTIELTHTFRSIINTTLSYSYVHDFATQFTDTTGSASYVQQRNLATQQIYSFNIGSQLPIAKWWTGYANFYYNYQFFDGVIGTSRISERIPSYGLNVQQSFTISEKYTAEVSGWYNGPSVWGLTWFTKPQGGVDVGFQRQFWNKNASWKIAATDIFFTAPWKARTDFGGMIVNGNGNWESRSVRASFTYRFGSSQISSARERKTGMDSEGSRIKGK